MSLNLALLSNLPEPSAKRIAIRVRPSAERALRAGHPWLYVDAIRRQSHEGQAGDLAVIFDRKGRFLDVGLYDPASPIRVRILHQGRSTPIDEDWFARCIVTAHQKRQPLRDKATTGYRLVHGENDGLPGLVIDRYAASYVLKLYTAAWIAHLPAVLTSLSEVTEGEQFVLRLSRKVQQETGSLHGLHDGTILGRLPLQNPLMFQENGFTFTCDPIHGQKTGFYLDQRENRHRVEELARGKVLNVFAYTGGFSLYAARGGARELVSLDISRPALAVARRHFELNSKFPAVAAARHMTLAGDAFTQLHDLAAQKREFDMVILDPPAFARRRDDVEPALAAYRRLTKLGLAVLRPGGTLVAASCSRPVSAPDFFNALHQSAGSIGRRLRELERTGHALDHPLTFKQGAYLKCLFAVA